METKSQTNIKAHLGSKINGIRTTIRGQWSEYRMVLMVNPIIVACLMDEKCFIFFLWIRGNGNI